MVGSHHQTTRLEGFSDAVFGFALTLLVVSLEVPSDLAGLQAQMQGFVGFALMFAMVCWIWYEHNWFFRRTGLQDPWTVFLNCVLLFVVLFYVYPMKFLTAALMFHFFGIGEAGGPRFTSTGGGNVVLLLYSAGVVVIFGVFTLLYRHALRGPARDAMTPDDAVAMRFARRGHVISMSIGVASIAIVGVMHLIGRPWLGALGGFIYMLMGPLHGWNGARAGRARAALAAEIAAVDRSGN